MSVRQGFTLAIMMTIAATSTLAGAAAAPAPRSSAVTTRAAVKPALSAEELHARAIELIRQNQHAKAIALLDQTFKATPPGEITRPMLLNRAIADLAYEKFLMRSIRDLGAYLERRGEEEDESATNVLGALLNVAARDPGLKRGAIWQRAYREWERRHEAMDRRHPGYRRWCAQWLTEEQHAEFKARQDQLEADIKWQQSKTEQAARYYRAKQAEAQSLSQYANATSVGGPNSPAGARPGEAPTYRDVQSEMWRQYGALQEQHRAAATAATAAQMILVEEQNKLAALQAQRARGEWPTAFDPIDPAELTPPPAKLPSPEAVAAPTHGPTSQPSP